MAFRIGLSITEFWCMTPYQFRLCADVYNEQAISKHNRESFLMYYGATIPKFKKIPDFEKFIVKQKITKNTVPKINERAIMDGLKAYKKAYDGRDDIK